MRFLSVLPSDAPARSSSATKLACPVTIHVRTDRACHLLLSAFALLACGPLGAAEAPSGVSGVRSEAAAIVEDGDGAEAAAEASPDGAANITQRIVRGTGDLGTTPPESGTYRIHLIDVGTGLADFNLLFDGGSADDKRGISATQNNSRLIAYLWEAIGPSGPKGCQPGNVSSDPGPDPERTIQTVVFSHPHEDHGVMLDEVLHCYSVEDVYLKCPLI
jgi:hypothetical protein